MNAIECQKSRGYMNGHDLKVGNVHNLRAKMMTDVGNGHQTELPQYKSHKIVQAAKIIGVSPWGVGDAMSAKLMLHPAGGDPIEIETKQGYYTKHRPTIGGYYVRYSDGYESFSPAEAFEEGYTRVE